MKKIIIAVFSLWIMVGIVNAQSDICPEIIQTAITTAAQECEVIGSGQACYAHDHVEAVFSPEFADSTFSSPGDLVDVSTVESLSLNALDVDAQTWGLALLQLNTGATPEESTTMIVFGDIELQNLVEAEPITLQVTAANNINIRSEPSADSQIAAGLSAGETIIADGRLEDNSWLRVQLPDSDGEFGWVFAEIVTVAGDVNMLQVRDSSTLELSGLQAFSFQSNSETPLCDEAPPSGILIQSPDETQVTLVVNDTQLQLNGTVFLQATLEEPLIISTIEGTVLVLAVEGAQIVPAGAQVSLALDTAPGSPEPYAEDALQALPLSLLDRPVTLIPALSADEIAAQTVCTVVALNDSNLRTGPGTGYAIEGRLPEGQSANPIGQATGADTQVWWQIDVAAWIRSDLVTTIGNCADLPEVEAPPLPVSAPSGSSATAFYRLESCTWGGEGAQSGETVQLSLSAGSWPTQDEARQATSQVTGTLSVDGGSLPTFFGTLNWRENDYGISLRANWVATPGTHTVSGALDLYGGLSYSCTFTVG